MKGRIRLVTLSGPEVKTTSDRTHDPEYVLRGLLAEPSSRKGLSCASVGEESVVALPSANPFSGGFGIVSVSMRG